MVRKRFEAKCHVHKVPVTWKAEEIAVTTAAATTTRKKLPWTLKMKPGCSNCRGVGEKGGGGSVDNVIVYGKPFA